jgi:type II secretory ATPase GspE/PulE/Tfp pilus assembly ATPase PilB-like protein
VHEFISRPRNFLVNAGMSTTTSHAAHALAEFETFLAAASPRDSRMATEVVERMLQLADKAGASDVHIEPSADALVLRWRLDGVLQPLGRLPKETAPNVVARLKVLAGLLTYEAALPQEGRICDEATGVEVRVSTFPSLFGERAVVRLLGSGNKTLATLDHLDLPAVAAESLRRALRSTSGAVLIVGPAGSGKTTTAYACLREVVATSGGGRSIASLEDPIEVAVDGVAQSQVNDAAGFDMAAGLRSLLRLDPEVILIGEMRDRATAQIALQAALTGQLVVTTFHAGHTLDAVNRLVDLGIPQYAVRNAVRLIVAQRLMRRLCTCARDVDASQHAVPLGLAVARCRDAVGCDVCHGTGYRGRCLLSEQMSIDDPRARQALSDQAPDGGSGDQVAGRADEGLWRSAEALVEAGVTSPLEVIRVLGFRTS